MDAQKPTDQQIIKEAMEGLQYLKQIENAPKWEQFNTKPCMMHKMEIEGRLAVKGQAKIDMPLKELFDSLGNPENLKKVSPNLKEIKILHMAESDGKKAAVVYIRNEGSFPVDDRDFVNVLIKEEGPDVCYISNRFCSFPHPKQNAVRAKMFIAGHIIKKIDQNTSEDTYISDVDLAGSIPQMVQNKMADKRGSVPSKIAEVFKK